MVAEPPGLAVQATRSIVGGIRAHPLTTVSATDSVIDANSATAVAYAALDGAAGGGALTLQGCTVVGKVHATLLSLVSDSIVWAELAVADPWQAALWADRKQTGCVRFSYLPQDPLLPRKYECVIEAAETPGPLFASLRYGDPEYAKLLPATDDLIRRGADEGGEMGAFISFWLRNAKRTSWSASANTCRSASSAASFIRLEANKPAFLGREQ